MREKALEFCSHILSWAFKGAVESKPTGSWRESPTVEKLKTTGSVALVWAWASGDKAPATSNEAVSKEKRNFTALSNQ
jgi:hypothetical protein